MSKAKSRTVGLKFCHKDQSLFRTGPMRSPKAYAQGPPVSLRGQPQGFMAEVDADKLIAISICDHVARLKSCEMLAEM